MIRLKPHRPFCKTELAGAPYISHLFFSCLVKGGFDLTKQVPLKPGPLTKRRQRSTGILTLQLSSELHCADNECGTWGGLLYPLRLHTV